MRLSGHTIGALVLTVLGGGAVAWAWVDEYKSGIIWPEPPVVKSERTGEPPSDAIVLFDGKDLSQWEGGDKWDIRDGFAEAREQAISTRTSYGDCQLHLEFATPEKVEGSGQGRGNSGVYFMGRYELQILDSFDNSTYFDGQCGAIYKQQPPIVNASRRPGEWQTYDVIFEGPKFDAEGKVSRPGYITVLHNGVLVQNHFELQGTTSYTEPPKYEAHPPRAPLQLQFHGNPIRFRNIWLRENIRPLEGRQP